MNGTNKSNKSIHQCKICIAPAIHSNYGVMSCPPCKMFFRRNAKIGQGKLKCDFDGQCEININNRHTCSACRLEKCFESGMQTDLIRGSRFKKNSKRRKKQKETEVSNSLMNGDGGGQLHQLPTLNLLQAHQSTLSIDQCNLFSNLMLCYDEQSVLSLAEQFIAQQNILPLKLRFKCGSVQNFLSTLFGKVQSLFNQNPHFRSLHPQDRSLLLHRQMKYLIILSSSFIAQQSHLFAYPGFNKATEILFGTCVTTTNKLLCFDVPFMKLAFGMICFSSYDYKIYEHLPTPHLTNIKRIVEVQDMYIELAWRYLVYVYDDKQAINYISNLSHCIQRVISDVVLMEDQKTFLEMMNIVIEQTQQSLPVESQ